MHHRAVCAWFSLFLQSVTSHSYDDPPYNAPARDFLPLFSPFFFFFLLYRHCNISCSIYTGKNIQKKKKKDSSIRSTEAAAKFPSGISTAAAVMRRRMSSFFSLLFSFYISRRDRREEREPMWVSNPFAAIDGPSITMSNTVRPSV